MSSTMCHVHLFFICGVHCIPQILDSFHKNFYFTEKFYANFFNKVFTLHLCPCFIVIAAEEIECRASWKDGSLYYLVAKIHHAHALTDEEKYRCFVYEFTNKRNKSSSGIQLAMSGDATCNGLLSPRDGSRTLSLSIGKYTFHIVPNKCKESVCIYFILA